MQTPPDASRDAALPPPRAGHGPADDEISLLDLALVLAQNRALIAAVAAVCVVLGLLLAVVQEATYTSSATLVREAQAEAPGGLSGSLSMLRGFGINLGSASTGLTPEAYPDIVRSREVRLAVVRDTFYIDALGREATFIAYVNAPGGVLSTVAQYTIGLPGLLLSALRDTPDAVAARTTAPGRLSEEEDEAIEVLSDLISVSEDLDTGLMRIGATTEEPLLSAELTRHLIDHLAERVRAVRTEKARQNLAFIEARFGDAAEELRRAEEALARFNDQNQSITSARLRTEQDRLQRQVSFKAQLYEDLQAQLTQAQIDLQRSEPVLTVLEAPMVPARPSGPRRALTVALSLLFGLVLGVGIAFLRAAVQAQDADPEERRKLDEIRAALPFGRKRRPRAEASS